MKAATHRHFVPIPPLAIAVLAGLTEWAIADVFPALRLESAYLDVVAAAIFLFYTTRVPRWL